MRVRGYRRPIVRGVASDSGERKLSEGLSVAGTLISFNGLGVAPFVKHEDFAEGGADILATLFECCEDIVAPQARDCATKLEEWNINRHPIPI